MRSLKISPFSIISSFKLTVHFRIDTAAFKVCSAEHGNLTLHFWKAKTDCKTLYSAQVLSGRKTFPKWGRGRNAVSSHIRNPSEALPLSNKKQKGLYSYLKHNDDILTLPPPDLIFFQSFVYTVPKVIFLQMNANRNLLLSLYGPSIQDSKILSLLYLPPGTNSGFVRLRAHTAEGRSHNMK